jgi:translation initiation factor IF-1
MGTTAITFGKVQEQMIRVGQEDTIIRQNYTAQRNSNRVEWKERWEVLHDVSLCMTTA